MKIALVGAECEENLALRYIRAALEVRGHIVTQITFNEPAGLDSAAKRLVATQSDLAGFSMVFTYRAREFAMLARRSRQLGFNGHLVAGGHFAAFNAEALLRDEPAFDSVAIGEGEEIMCALADYLDSLAAVAGLVWRDKSGAVHRNGSAEKPPDLDRLPWPVRMEPPDKYLGLPVANVLASRGCTHACAFCSIAAWHGLCGGPRLRLREPAAVAEEMASLYARGYRIFNFHDDNFFQQDRHLNLQRFWRLRGELQARSVGHIAFAVKSRPDIVDEETFAFLKDFGLFRVFLGIEAGTARSLGQLGRKQTLEQNHRALETVNRLDLHACFNLLLLNPESTLDDFRANVAFLRSYSINPMNFCRTEIYAGTPLEKRLRRERRLLGNYWGYNYIISDPRAQTAFELMYAGLEGRHFGEDCVHHLAMRVDFECQLLKHFRGCPDSLHKKAKEFVRNVNLNSCDYLDEIADAAATGFGSSEERSKFLAGLRARVAGDNHCFAEEGMALVARVNQDPQSQVGRARMWQQEAAVLLSSLALVATSCSPIFTEMAPRPSTTDNQLQQRILERALLPKIAPLLANPAPLRVYAVVDESGKCASLGVFNLGTHQAVTVPPELLQKLDFPELKNTRWDVTFSSEEVSRFFQSTHIFEMAPLPNRGK